MESTGSYAYPPYIPPPRKRNIFRRILLWLMLLLGFAVALLFVVSVFFDKQITNRLVAEINKNLKTELSVGSGKLSLFTGFPKASVNLSQVRLKDALGGHLLAAEELSFRFDLLSVFSNDIKIHTVLVRDGAVRVVVNRQGKSNTEIFKEKTPGPAPQQPQPESKLRLAVENAELRNMAVLYDNARTGQAAELSIDEANVAGNLSASQFSLNSRADFKVVRLDSDSSRYLAGEKMAYDAKLVVDRKKGVYGFQQVELKVGGNTFSVNGVAVTKPDYTDLNLKLASQEGDISMIANLLPGEYREYFKEFQSSGNYACNGTVKGRLSKTEKPAVSFEVALHDGKIVSEKLKSPLRDVSFRTVYNARADGSGEFEIADFKGEFGGHPLGLVLKVTNLDDPLVDFRANGILPLGAAYGLFDMPEITAGDGFIRLNKLSVQGRYADMVSMRRVGNVNASGEVQFENAQVTYNNVPVTAENGFLRLQDNEFRLDSFLLRAGNSDFALEGMARNLLPVLFSDSLNSTDALLEFTSRLKMQQLDVTQLLDMFTVQETASEVGGQQNLDSLKVEKNAGRSIAFDKLKGVFDASIGNFKYGKIEGQNFLGKFAFDHNNLTIKGNAFTMQGSINLDGNARFDLAPMLKMRIVAQEIDLKTCLAQCENFGQEVVTDQNLRGRLNARVVLWAYWDTTGEFQMDKLKALADLRSRDGQLVNLRMLEDFSSFVHIEDLRDVRFRNLQNYLEITNKRLYLPVMFIQSNALNMTLSGEHTFDNDIDYKIKINAGQVLFNRIKKHDPGLDPLPAEKGLFNVFYTIVGNLDKYDMKRGKKAVKAEFERSEARKKTIAAMLDAEFRAAGIDVMQDSASGSDGEEYLDEITAGGKKN